MTNVSCKKRKARPARVHEGARFNQTFYPYACVLFSAPLRSAARASCRQDSTQVKHPARRGQTCLLGVEQRRDRRCARSASACVRSRPGWRPGAAQGVRRG
ncbi:MAG: hypothetical protein EOO80_07330 [Oxalobacteraceae bacterium]|nr:MAG: hypothetical protein EOO80_07330 [Oxalobacteraceae bacterium]